MKRQGLYIPRLNWEVTIYYNSDKGDAEEILHTLDTIGCDDETFFLAQENLRNGALNSGLTYTNAKERESVIVLSQTTSKEEFANTWFHELIHCATHIARALDIDLESETLAYIGGDLAMAMQPVAAHLMCPDCKD